MDGLNTYFVSKVTREAGLAVALSGLGGDELFGGYNGYQKSLSLEHYGRRLQRFPHWLRSPAAHVLYLLFRNEKARRLGNLLQTQQHPYFLARQLYSPQQIGAILAPDIAEASNDWEPSTFGVLEQETRDYDEINRQSAFELQTYMLSTLLRDTDQMSMAHALEVRVPLLDHVLVEHLFTLPGSYKIDGEQPKPLLTRPLKGGIPDACAFRPKRGFELPFAVWLRESLESEIRASLRERPSHACYPFMPEGLQTSWEQFQQGHISWSRVWSLFVLQHWLDTHRVVA
jgi:asparagine synthase (glutamine-hydrolysing)